jgi:hypothetical protein
VTITPIGTTPRAASRNRRLIVIALAVVGLAVVLEFAWAGFRLATSQQVTPQGTAVSIPGGQVTVESVEHALPSELGTALPADSHVVAVTLTVTADAGAPLLMSASDYVIDGIGVPAAIVPSRVTPQDARVPAGSAEQISLMYAVPDLSTDLVLDLPGGAKVSAEHADHPGDRAAS